jgi:hypothetical protein
MKLAIITCQKLPQGVKEDLSLYEALSKLNIDSELCIWNEEKNWSQYDACLLRSVWDYHDHLNEFNGWLTQTNLQTKIFNSIETIKWNQNKYYLKDLQEFGITVAPTLWLNAKHSFDIESYCHKNTTETFFLKPVVGADSSGTLRFANDSDGITEAKNHLARWLPQIDMMLQPYLKSVETHGETSTIYINGQFTHAVRKIPVNGDYRVQDTYGAQDVIHQPNAAELSLSKAALDFIKDQFGTPLYARFDFLQDTHGNVYLNEAELIEPSLFFHHCPKAAQQLALSLQQIILDQSSVD